MVDPRTRKLSKGKKYFVDAVAQRVGDATDDGAADFAGGHFAQLSRGHVRIEGGVRRADQVGHLFERTWSIRIAI